MQATRTAAAFQQFRLWIEWDDRGRSRGRANNRRLSSEPLMPEIIEVPAEGISWLTLGFGERPRIELHQPLDAAAAVALEPLRRERRPYLTMLVPDGISVQLNGMAAPPAAMLRSGDQIQVADEVLHVTLFSRPYVGPADDRFAGVNCPVCLLPIREGTIAWVCPRCETALHCMGEEAAEHERLQCALTGAHCPVCQLPVRMTEGYLDAPEF